MMPSCVPATHVDDNGCILTAGKMKGYLEHPRILGLGEVMDAPSVINGSVAMHEKLQLFQDRVKDGHAPFLAPGDLAAYVLGGIDTDHECVDYEYAMAEARNGMQVLILRPNSSQYLCQFFRIIQCLIFIVKNISCHYHQIRILLIDHDGGCGCH